MKKSVKKAIIYATACCLLAPSAAVVPNAPFSIVAEAHSGRTDSNGGHKDNKNASGLGSYHYHCGGNPAHLHTNGECPYSNISSVDIRMAEEDIINNITSRPLVEATEPTNEKSTGTWRQNNIGWWFELPDGKYYKEQFALIDGQTYYFNADGYMLIGWTQMGGCWFYFNGDGTMATGYKDIDGVFYHFDTDGAMLES